LVWKIVTISCAMAAVVWRLSWLHRIFWMHATRQEKNPCNLVQEKIELVLQSKFHNFEKKKTLKPKPCLCTAEIWGKSIDSAGTSSKISSLSSLHW
jgi:hypothetical protein